MLRPAPTHLLIHSLAATGMLALSSCGPPAGKDGNGDGAVDAQLEQQAPLDNPESGSIPAAFRGNWGLTAADCQGGAAATGLLEIDARTLTFYESVGTVGQNVAVEPHSIQTVFAFEGEGMEWAREMKLEIRENGDVLLRQELGDGASPGVYEYRKCSPQGEIG